MDGMGDIRRSCSSMISCCWSDTDPAGTVEEPLVVMIFEPPDYLSKEIVSVRSVLSLHCLKKCFIIIIIIIIYLFI
jgi:hypothetical protein